MRTAVTFLDRVGSAGALIAAVAAPCCFPIFAAVAATLGLSALGVYENVVLCLLQASAVVALVGLLMAFGRHRHIGPLALGMASAGLLFYALHVSFVSSMRYAGLFGLLAASVWNYFCSRAPRQENEIHLQSVVTCPHCGHTAEETMPTNACLFFYDCPACHARLKPQPGDCCVFCSYGSVRCPPIQAGAPCCA